MDEEEDGKSVAEKEPLFSGIETEKTESDVELTGLWEKAAEGLKVFFNQLGPALYVTAMIAELKELEEPAREGAVVLENTDIGFAINQEQRESVRNIALFFGFAGQVTERLLRQLVVTALFVEEAQTEEIENIVDQYNSNQCLNLLHAGGVIDDQTKSQLGQMRKMRNEMMHGVDAWFTPEEGHRIRAQIDRTMRGLENLLKIVDEEEDEMFDVSHVFKSDRD